jgi:hypothetical protein
LLAHAQEEDGSLSSISKKDDNNDDERGGSRQLEGLSGRGSVFAGFGRAF